MPPDLMSMSFLQHKKAASPLEDKATIHIVNDYSLDEIAYASLILPILL